MSVSVTEDHGAAVELAALREIEKRVLWLAMAIVHHANRVRSDPSGLKVGGTRPPAPRWSRS